MKTKRTSLCFEGICKKMTAGVLASLMTVSLLSGCDMKKKEGEGKDISYLSSCIYNAGKETVDIWYEDDAEKEWLEGAASEFTEKYGIEVKLKKNDSITFFEDMNKACQNDEGVDGYIVSNDQLELSVNSGMAEEVENPEDALADYPEVSRKAFDFKGKTYGYPMYFDTYCLVYDSNLLKEEPKSIEDILVFLDEYEDTGSTKAVFRWDVADPYINTMFLADYANIFGENGDDKTAFKVNDEKSVESMKYFQSLSQYLWMDKNNISHDVIMNRIKEGTLVIGLCKSDILPVLMELQGEGKAAEKVESTEASSEVENSEEAAENSNENTEESNEGEASEDSSEETAEDAVKYTVAPVPEINADLTSTIYSTTTGIVVNPYGDNTDGAHAFAYFVTHEYKGNGIDKSGKLPVINRGEMDGSFAKVIYNQYLESKPVPKVMVLGDYILESAGTFDRIWEGKDAKEELDDLQKRMDEKIISK